MTARIEKLMEGNTSISRPPPEQPTQEIPDRAALQSAALLREAHHALALVLLAERRREPMPLTPGYLEGLVGATGERE